MLAEVTTAATSYYRRTSPTTFAPTEHVQGAWRETEQHMGPVSGLLTHALETTSPRPDLQLCRISYEILGVIAADESTVEVEVVRPGRTIEMLEARMIIGGRTAVRATGWRLAIGDTAAVAGGQPEPLPAPNTWPSSDISTFWSGGYIDSLDFHIDPASEPGSCRAWLSTEIDLVEGEPSSDLARFTALVDAANGIAARQPPKEWLYPNTDLTLHFFRTPRFAEDDHRVGLDARAIWGPSGVGLTSTTLYDAAGPVGRAEQILTVRPMP
ncbi:Thioesterase-like superfamily protein [Microlunatus soli]|uniref:Thioesterase-like superfamily protein n=1 Tax=Microlunatus soli TaxID=630515 RepID=A0A1H1ME54_9ACTN|nr:Thioesterase-like superfamily protein [Microlunatus soli]